VSDEESRANDPAALFSGEEQPPAADAGVESGEEEMSERSSEVVPAR